MNKETCKLSVNSITVRHILTSHAILIEILLFNKNMESIYNEQNKSRPATFIKNINYYFEGKVT